jgi:hypothetical protein
MATPTFTKIATVTVGSGGASSIDFSSIPSTYTDLCILASLRATVNGSGDGQNPGIKFNGNTTGYPTLYAYGNGSGKGSNKSADFNILINASDNTDDTASVFANVMIYISNYNSSNYKSFFGDYVRENNATEGYVSIDARRWNNTTAITSISIYRPLGGNHAQYSTATLYGIKNS